MFGMLSGGCRQPGLRLRLSRFHERQRSVAQEAVDGVANGEVGHLIGKTGVRTPEKN